MTLRRITAPTLMPVTLPEFRDYAQFAVTTEDAKLEEALLSAINHFDGPGGDLNRALLTQTWEYVLDGFCERRIRLPLPPLQSVTSITYRDELGTSQTLASSAYVVAGVGGDDPASISPAYSLTWPTTYPEPEAVVIRFVAGWTTPALVPGVIRTGIKAIATWMREQAVPVNVGNIVNALPMHVDQQLERYRVRWV